MSAEKKKLELPVFFKKNNHTQVKEVTFSTTLPEKISNLISVVSKDSTAQTGIPFQKFIQLVNLNLKIEKVTILDTTYLHRHYGIESQEFNQAWINKNKEFLDDLKVPYEMISWKSIIETQDFSNFQEKIRNLYKTTPDFFNLVKKKVKKYISINGEKAAIEYALEECAGSCVLSRMGNITYPGKISRMIKYCLNQFVEEPLEYLQYRIRYHGEKTKFTREIIEKINSLSIPEEKHNDFLDKFKLLCEEFIKETKINQPPESQNI